MKINYKKTDDKLEIVSFILMAIGILSAIYQKDILLVAWIFIAVAWCWSCRKWRQLAEESMGLTIETMKSFADCVAIVQKQNKLVHDILQKKKEEK